MVGDIFSEQRLTVTEAAHRAGVSPGAAWRWVLYGIRGGTVKLESYLLGGKRYTSEEALARFSAACTAAGAGAPSSSPRTSKQRQKAIEQAERELSEAGI